MSAVAEATQALFVLEQTLGNAVYGSLVERAAAEHPRIEAAVVRVGYEQAPALARLPVVGNWTLRSSLIALSAVARARDASLAQTRMFMAKAMPYSATARPMRPYPKIPSVRPRSVLPTPHCQLPASSDAICCDSGCRCRAPR